MVLVVASKLLDLKVMEALKQAKPLAGPAEDVLESLFSSAWSQDSLTLSSNSDPMRLDYSQENLGLFS